MVTFPAPPLTDAEPPRTASPAAHAAYTIFVVLELESDVAVT